MQTKNTTRLFQTISLTSFFLAVTNFMMNHSKLKDLQNRIEERERDLLNATNQTNQLLVENKDLGLKDIKIDQEINSKISSVEHRNDFVSEKLTKFQQNILKYINDKNKNNTNVNEDPIMDRITEDVNEEPIIDTINLFGNEILDIMLTNKNDISVAKEILQNKYSGGNSGCSNYIEPMNDLLSIFSSLSYEENLAIIHLSGSISILLSLLSIIFIFYGNIIIDYLQLEVRFPKLAKFIQLRRKFQQFYLFINILIISVISIIIIYINLLLLMN
nr:hypothetical protein [Grifola frondosa]